MVWIRNFRPLGLLTEPLRRHKRKNDGDPESILLVGSDHPLTMLHDLQLTDVHLAITPRQAVRMAWNREYDLVVLALGLSQCLTTLRTLQRVPNYEFTPVIAITEQSNPAERMTLRDRGVHDIIAAPATAQALRTAISQAVACARDLQDQSFVAV